MEGNFSGHYKFEQGIAVEDLADDSIILKIASPHMTPGAFKGTLGSGITELNIFLKDRDGNPIQTTATTANHIVASWEGGSNVKYPPLVRKGEPVEYYKVGDQDKYYWRATGRGKVFRKTDRVYIEVPATDPSKDTSEEKDETNTYSAYLDSDQKRVGFKTSKKNGEVVAMVMEADLEKGTLIISDDSGGPNNRIFLDTGKVSGTPVIQFNLNNGSMVKMEGEDLIMKVKGRIAIKSEDRIILDAPLVLLNIQKVGSVVINAASVYLNAAADIISSAGGVLGLNAAATKVSGFFAAGAARLESLTKGPSGSEYSGGGVSGDGITGDVSSSTNSSDTSPGTPTSF